MARKKRRLWLKGCLLTVAVMVLLVIVSFLAAPGLIERYYFTPQGRVGFHAWQNDKIHLPDETLSAEPFKPATREAAAKFAEAWKLNQKAAESLFNELQGMDPLQRRLIDPETLDYAMVQQRLAVLQPIMDAFAELVSQPDYTIQAAASDSDYDANGELPVPEFRAIQANVILMRLRTYCQVHDRKLEDAEKTVSLMTRATRVEPYDPIVSSLIGIFGRTITADAWIHLVRNCEDRTMLRRMLDAQIEQARHPVLYMENMPFPVANSIGELRELRRRGIRADYQDKTGFELLFIVERVKREYLEKVVIPQVRSNPEMAKAAEAALQQHDTRYLDTSTPIVKTFLRAMIYADIDRKTALKKDPTTRSYYSAVKIDLLAVETSKKLYTLDHGRPPATLADLVPQYIPQIPRDRFADAAPVKFARDCYYSVGPDKSDDHAAIMYDATNGTASVGDVFFDR